MAKLIDRIKLKLFKKVEIRATEGEHENHDALTGSPKANTTSKIRKNNFGTYSKQVNTIKENYLARSAYGVTLTRAVIDYRAAFICGGGISVKADSPAAQKWVDNFLDVNKLSSIRLIQIVELLEKEGKALIIIKRDGVGDESNIRIRIQPWTEIEYHVDVDEYRDPISVEIFENKKDIKNKKYAGNNFVYINIGGCVEDIDITPPPIANVLTEIENYERALFDLRASNHVFGTNRMAIETKTREDANYIQAKLNEAAWDPEKSYTMPAKAYYLSPPAGGIESVRGEMALNVKIISANTGLPVHWIGWTDLMSNRATAETLDELIKFVTKKQRTAIAEGYDELIQKAAAIARAFGETIPEFEADIELPNITSADLAALNDIYLPLKMEGAISMQTLRGLIPGIDPAEEEKQIEKEEKEKPDKVVKGFNQFVDNDNNNEGVIQNGQLSSNER